MTRLGHYLFLGGNNGLICYIGRWCKTMKRAVKNRVAALGVRSYRRWLFIGWIKRNDYISKIENNY